MNDSRGALYINSLTAATVEQEVLKCRRQYGKQVVEIEVGPEVRAPLAWNVAQLREPDVALPPPPPPLGALVVPAPPGEIQIGTALGVVTLRRDDTLPPGVLRLIFYRARRPEERPA